MSWMKISKRYTQATIFRGYKMLYNYVYLHCTGEYYSVHSPHWIAGKLKNATLLYLDLQQNAIFCHHMLLLYHNFIALNENPIFAGMNPFNFACQNPLSEQLSHSTVQCSSTWVDMRVWVLRGESGTRMKSARNSFVKPGAPMMLLN